MIPIIQLIKDDTLGVTFPYDAKIVELIKLLRVRRWNPSKKRWEVHLSHLPELLRIFKLEEKDVAPEIVAQWKSAWSQPGLRVRLGPLKGKLTGPGAPIDKIDAATSFLVPGSKFSPKFKSGQWDGRKHLFDARAMTFPAGLWPKIEKQIKAAKVEYEIAEDPAPPDRFQPLGAGPAKVSLRPYQLAALESALAGKRGIIQMATGGGKTMLAAHLLRRLDRPAIFFVHTLDLLYQAARVFERELGREIGILGDGQATLRPVTVATIQTVANACSGTRPARRKPDDDEEEREERPVHFDEATRREVIDFLESVPVVIFDECHHVPADTFYKIAMRTVGATHRYGLSATPWRDDGADLMLEAALGPCIHQTRASDLIDAGYLVRPLIQMQPAPIIALRRKIDYHDCYGQAIVENRERNRVIAARARQWAAEGCSVLILVAHVAHGLQLSNLLPEARFAHGGLDSELRRQYLAELEQKLHPIMIATTLADEGLDVPTLGGLILAGGGKSQTRAFQRIGRVLRPAGGKTQARVLDFLDDAPWLRNHSQARLALYRQEPRFQIQMLRREFSCPSGS
ncbi:DEAD/DEAH box helicase [bacterium]|nr:DEAD/DEAH box helicase [bacterium]